jgi:hypothetical protein
VRRVAQVIECAAFGFSVANVHLSHGQIMNRRQLRRLVQILPSHAAVLGDFNLVGPTLMPSFRDVGPARPPTGWSTWCPSGSTAAWCAV